MTRFRIALLGMAVIGSVLTWAANPNATVSRSRLAEFDAYRELRRASPHSGISWSFLGPTTMSGRANDVAVADRGGQRRIYVAYAGGGLWQTDDLGATWKALFSQAASTAIHTVAIAPSNPDVVWLLTGSTRGASKSPASAGAFKSLDAGRTWESTGLPQIQIASGGRLVIHPTDPNILYAAIVGQSDTTDDAGGVFKTVNGGQSWMRVLAPTPRSGGVDLVMDPRNPDTLLASIKTRPDPPTRQETRLFRTTNGGGAWTESGKGLPEPRFTQRIALDAARSRDGVFYALVNNRHGRGETPNASDPLLPGPQWTGPEIYRSDDRGASWRKVSLPDDAILRPENPAFTWTSQIRVDPRDDQTIYALGVLLNVSHDGGRSFSRVVGPHADHNGLWLDPSRSGVVYDCNDAGFHLSEDGGYSGQLALVPAAQFYNVELDSAKPFHVYSSRQDDASWRVAVDLSAGRDRLTAGTFERAPGGEATNHAIDPVNPNTVYAARDYGVKGLLRADLAVKGTARYMVDIAPAVPAGEPALRGQFLAPIVLSPHDPQTLYVGFQYLFRSRDRGDHWERLSADLSENDPTGSRRPGARPDNPEAVNQAIATIAESPRKAGLIYAGTDDGHLHVTKDAGATWTELTSHLPRQTWVSRVVPSAFADGTVFVTQHGRLDNDTTPYLLKSTDYGQTFTSIAASIPAGPVNVIREDPANAHVLYVGTDFGVLLSENDGVSWEVLGGNLPAVPVTDLKIHPRDRVVVISTFGAGLWALDADQISQVVPRAGFDADPVDPRQAAMAGRDARQAFRAGGPDLWAIAATLGFVVVSLVCGPWVLIKVVRASSGWHAVGTAALWPYGFGWGWVHAKRERLRAVMTFWTLGWVVFAVAGVFNGFVGEMGLTLWLGLCAFLTTVLIWPVQAIVLNVWVVARMFRHERAWKGSLGLCLPPFAFVWGWLHGQRLGLRSLMAAWTIGLGGSVVGVVVMYFFW